MVGLTLKCLGDIEVVRGGERMELPPSRKTRALFAYLALSVLGRVEIQGLPNVGCAARRSRRREP
jgi:DNA-binding SARP family transcriptional activator